MNQILCTVVSSWKRRLFYIRACIRWCQRDHAVMCMVVWPSGLRRWFKEPVISMAWVRIPPLPFTVSHSGNFEAGDEKKMMHGKKIVVF